MAKYHLGKWLTTNSLNIYPHGYTITHQGAQTPHARRGTENAMPREAVTTSAIAQPVGPFSPAILAGDFIFISGQVAQSSTSAGLITGGVGPQTEQVIANLRAILAAAGKTLADVVRVGVYLTDMKDFAAMNAVYQRHFDAPYPARTTIGVMALPLGASVEIDLVAR
jgi:2-iminobutanoate/2-iminopropanoate deaminase